MTRWFFFDLDGTLADSLPGLEASIQEALISGGRQLRVANLRPFIGPGIRVILKNLENDLTEAELDSMERCFRASYDTNGVQNAHLFDGVKSTLEWLHDQAAALFLVTNKPKLATSNLLEQHGIAGLFREVLSRNSREPSYSSKAEMLLDLIAKHAVEKEAAVMVGDTVEDFEAARMAGISFVFVEYGYGELGEDATCMRVSQFAQVAAACGFIQERRAPMKARGTK